MCVKAFVHVRGMCLHQEHWNTGKITERRDMPEYRGISKRKENKRKIW